MKRRLSVFVAFAFIMAFTAPLLAGTIDFENVPQTYWYYGGQQNFGNYWQGVYFGPQATILETQVYGYNSAGYPPHSGYAVLFSISNPTIEADFASPTSYVSMWYTTSQSFTVTAYDALNNVLQSVTPSNNYGSNSFLIITQPNIAYVTMAGTGNYFTIDDFSADFVTGRPTVPLPASVLLFGPGLVGLAAVKRRFKK